MKRFFLIAALLLAGCDDNPTIPEQSELTSLLAEARETGKVTVQMWFSGSYWSVRIDASDSETEILDADLGTALRKAIDCAKATQGDKGAALKCAAGQ